MNSGISKNKDSSLRNGPRWLRELDDDDNEESLRAKNHLDPQTVYWILTATKGWIRQSPFSSFDRTPTCGRHKASSYSTALA